MYGPIVMTEAKVSQRCRNFRNNLTNMHDEERGDGSNIRPSKSLKK